ncbi:ABC transporter substrate-binding protein [Arthrobacter russicus]|uniref:Multiple sugar transport system substrate-binding protein n=1 Tax=Arthrobacter russicus TaxID=172040 RepID=A0ABU1JAP1_9MICC|nr:ABC transporter substrate-binding protein [Arthrobacter russicus]MDR6269494.1 multiple sugar transport system substrate-binding protein [Arthrobacter russicus]
MKFARTVVPLVVAGVLAAGLSACGSASASDYAEQNLEGRGPITFVQGKDNNGVIQPIIDRWNAKYPEQKVTLKEQTDQADQQRDDLVRNFQARNSGYDVVRVDVVWTAEFAAKRWLQPLTGSMAVDTSGMLPATVAAATYQNTLFASPVTSDGGMLYYRSDLVPNPPKTWAEMMSMCSIAKANNMSCFAGQYAQYEGLTVNAAEAINSAGGQILDEQSKLSINTPEAKAGLSNLVEAYRNGNIPVQAVTYQEEQSRQAFQDGNLLFLRNWPYVYSLASTDATSKVAGKFAVTALPGQSGAGASSLGGASAGISVFSKNKATARDFVQFLTSEEIQRFYVTQASNAPVLAKLYDDPELVAKLPYLPVLKTSIENAVPRPVTPFYPAVTKAIQSNAYAAIRGQKSVDQAIIDMQKSMEAAGVK